MKVCIDPGHGGSDPGAIGELNRNKIFEKDIVLDIAYFLEDELGPLGHRTYFTRRVDETLSLQQRSSYANQKKVDLFVSIHCNSASSSQAEGIETWIYPFSQRSRPYAQRVQDSLMATFPNHKNRGVKEANFHVLRETEMPAILVECEFINNPNQAKFLADENNQKLLAKAIANGIGR